MQGAQPGDLAVEPVADLGPYARAQPHARWGAGQHDVARLQRQVLADPGNELRHRPDHVLGVRVLPDLSVEGEPQLQVAVVDEPRRDDAGAQRAAVVERLTAEQVELDQVLGMALPVSGREVQTDGVARDVVAGVLDSDVPTALWPPSFVTWS